MTTDAFTTAARTEAQLASLDRNGRIGGVGDLGVHMAEWARDHLARQEVTGAEVTAALLELHYRTGRTLDVGEMRGILNAARRAAAKEACRG